MSGSVAVVIILAVVVHLHRTAADQHYGSTLSLEEPIALPELTSTALLDGPARIRTDRKVYLQPPLIPLPRAGGKIIDPVFATEIMRVTDVDDCPPPGCGTYYSQWPTFNADNTRLLIRLGETGDVLIKAFDPVTFSVGATLRKSPTLRGGVAAQWQGATWSRVDPDLIFVTASYYDANYLPVSGMKLFGYRPSTNSFKLLKDFAASLAPGQPDYLFEMHVDAHDDVFTFMENRVGDATNPIYFIVWQRSTDSVLKHIRNDATFDANAASPDKSGRWIWFALNKTQSDGSRHRILDLKTDGWQTIHWRGDDDPPSHGDMGTGFAVGHGNFTGGFNYRSMVNVNQPRMLFDFKDVKGVVDWTQDQHTTLYADDESWITIGLYDDGSAKGLPNTGAFKNEVMQIALDGSQRIRRLFHHRSVIDNLSPTTSYWAIPKPTISRDGHYIAFTSNWGNSGRYDLFIAKIEPAPNLGGSAQKITAPTSGDPQFKSTRPRRTKSPSK